MVSAGGGVSLGICGAWVSIGFESMMVGVEATGAAHEVTKKVVNSRKNIFCFIN